MNKVPFKPAIACGILLACVTAARSQSLAINTLAGYAGQGNADGGGSYARFSNPCGAAVDGTGNVYVADTDNHTIRQITAGGLASTLAGLAGVNGSADGTGSSSRFNQPQGVAVDSVGNVFVADTGNHTIRKITPVGTNWVVSTLAGLAGASGSANGKGTNAQFYEPEGVAVDSGGNVYVADTWNHTIRKITPAGVVSTLAGSAGNYGSTDATGSSAQFYQPQGVAVDGGGNVYVGDTGNHTIRKVTPGGVVTTLAGLAGNYGSTDGTGTNARFYQPAGVAVDGAGNVYVADYFNSAIRKITPAGAVSTLAGLAGNYGSADGTNTSARFWGPQGVTVKGTNNVTVYVADTGNGTIRSITPVGSNWTVSTLAGSASDGSADATGGNARFYWPGGVGCDTGGNLYVADSENSTIRQITPAGVVSTLAGSAGASGSADGTGTHAQFYGPQGVALDTGGNVYVADTANGTIRKITSAGVVSTLAGLAGTYGSADGTGTNAQFWGPQSLAVDNSGNVYVADTWNHTIRKIGPAGVVTTLAGSAGNRGSADGTNSAARFNWPYGIALDGAGNVFVSDYFNHTLRKITPAGRVSTLAGMAGLWGNADGTNSAARFFEPAGVAVDGGGNVYVVDSGNQTIRKVTPVGTNWVVSTVAGLAGVSGSAGGVGSDARFCYPAGLAVNGAGSFSVADSGNNTIRVGWPITNAAPMIFTQPQGQSVNPGGSVTFTVTAAAMTPLVYQWRFNSASIAGATGSSYTRTNAQAGDLGNYSVVITNQVGSVTSSNALLSLIGPPSIVTQPQDQIVVAGHSATFSVIASGTQPLNYQWWYNGNSLPGATAAVFTLGSASSTNAGLYSVVVTNPLSAAVSSNALLAVTALDAWGDNSWGQLNVPAECSDVIAIAAGAWHSLALRTEGTVVAWGDDSNGQCDVPATLESALAIAAGGYHSLALRADGTVAAWGANDYTQTNVPLGLANVIAISAGTWHSLALRRDGTVVAWGDNSWGQTEIPTGLSNVVAIAAGGNHSLALQADGTMVAWGENTDAQGGFAGQSVVPLGLTNVVELAAGEYHSLALQADGTVVTWGDNSQGQCSVPVGLSNVAALAGGGAHSLALRVDGTVVAWGANWNGQCSLPPTLSDVVGIGAGESHSLALVAGSLPVPRLLSPAWQTGRFSVLLQTLHRKYYALEYKDSASATNWSPLSTNLGNGALRLLSDPAAAVPQRFYRLRQW
jgi:hypothetical protein